MADKNKMPLPPSKPWSPVGTKVLWKVPFRQVYNDSFRSWLRSTFWCHVVLRLYPGASDSGHCNGPATPGKGHAV
jgi:hypothetical protein